MTPRVLPEPVAAADRALRAIEEIRRGLSPRLQPLGIVVAQSFEAARAAAEQATTAPFAKIAMGAPCGGGSSPSRERATIGQSGTHTTSVRGATSPAASVEVAISPPPAPGPSAAPRCASQRRVRS